MVQVSGAASWLGGVATDQDENERGPLGERMGSVSDTGSERFLLGNWINKGCH